MGRNFEDFDGIGECGASHGRRVASIDRISNLWLVGALWRRSNGSDNGGGGGGCRRNREECVDVGGKECGRLLLMAAAAVATLVAVVQPRRCYSGDGVTGCSRRRTIPEVLDSMLDRGGEMVILNPVVGIWNNRKEKQLQLFQCFDGDQEK